MALRKVPGLTEVAAQIAGTSKFLHGEIDRIEEQVVRTKNVSSETILETLKLIRVLLDSNEKTADAVTVYDSYLRKEHGIDTDLIVAIKD